MSIQTTFNKNLQGTNTIYGNIISNDDASFDDINSNTITSNTLTSNTSTSLNNTALRGTTTIGTGSSGASLSIGGFGSVLSTNGNWTWNGGNLNFNTAIQQTNSSSLNYYNGALLVGSNNTALIGTNKLFINGALLMGNVLRIKDIGLVVSPTTDDVISYGVGQINYWSNGVNTATHTSTSITNNVNTNINTLLRVGNGNNIFLDGNNTSINTQGTWIQWNRQSGSGRTFIINQKGSAGNGSTKGGFSFGESSSTNVLTEYMTLNEYGLSFVAPLYQGSYQRKALLSPSGALNNYPSWTTMTNTSSGGVIQFNIGTGSPSDPYFDTDITHFSKIKIHFQGVVSTTTTSKPNLRIYPLTNNSTSPSNMECAVWVTNRTTSTLIPVDVANSNIYCQIMNNIEIPNNEFGGEIIYYIPTNSSSRGNEFEVNASYLKASIGSTRVFGSWRCTNTTNLIFNGINFYFDNLQLTNQTIVLKYYIEHL